MPMNTMTAASIPLLRTRKRISIWLISVSFVLFQFFLQLSSGVLIGALISEMKLSALYAGILSSSFYFVYTTMQIPVGVLFDKQNTRYLLAVNALICSLGCFIFAQSHHFFSLMMGRLLIGAGSAFAFVGLSHLLREYFPIRQFGFMIGLSETLGFLVTVLGIIGLGTLVHYWGWRSFVNAAAIIGLMISFFCWQFIPDRTSPRKAKNTYFLQLTSILKNKQAWANGLFVGLSFTVITVFAAMWAVPFIRLKLACGLKEASLIDAMIFLGAGLSCPLFGKLSIYFSKQKPLIIASCLSTALLILIALFAPIKSHALFAFLMFMIGLCCGAYMLAFSIANELAPKEALSTCTGFTNTLAMITAPIFQIAIGFLLDWLYQGQGYKLENYQQVLTIIPLCLILGAFLTRFLPEKGMHNSKY